MTMKTARALLSALLLMFSIGAAACGTSITGVDSADEFSLTGGGPTHGPDN